MKNFYLMKMIILFFLLPLVATLPVFANNLLGTVPINDEDIDKQAIETILNMPSVPSITDVRKLETLSSPDTESGSKLSDNALISTSGKTVQTGHGGIKVETKKESVAPEAQAHNQETSVQGQYPRDSNLISIKKSKIAGHWKRSDNIVLEFKLINNKKYEGILKDVGPLRQYGYNTGEKTVHVTLYEDGTLVGIQKWRWTSGRSEWQSVSFVFRDANTLFDSSTNTVFKRIQ